MTIPYQPSFVPAPPSGLPPEFHVWALQVVSVLNGVLAGKLNITSDVTLTENVGSTDIIDARISPFSTILFMPLTANAATEMAAGTMRVSSQTAGQATIDHANAASTDRQFRFVIIA